jgi:hypothetical protein
MKKTFGSIRLVNGCCFQKFIYDIPFCGEISERFLSWQEAVFFACYKHSKIFNLIFGVVFKELEVGFEISLRGFEEEIDGIEILRG